MPKYFIGPPEGARVTLRGDAAHHLLRVLRLRPGTVVTLCDGERTDYTALLRDTGPKDGECVFELIAHCPSQTEPLIPMTVYQAHPKGDKLETVIQKCVELGASRIVPLHTAHAPGGAAEKKRPRYKKIAEAAAGQSMRGIIPEVAPVVPFAEAVKSAAEPRGANAPLWLVALSPSETAAGRLPIAMQPLSTLREAYPAPPSIGVWIGPEGGFAPEEVQALLTAGAHPVSLGPRVLRTETAAPALLAQISLLWEYGKGQEL